MSHETTLATSMTTATHEQQQDESTVFMQQHQVLHLLNRKAMD